MRAMVAVLCMLAVASPAGARERKAAGDDFRSEYERVINICVAQVRKESMRLGSRFDAYLEGTAVKFFGTPEEHFQFRKCMSRRGLPLNAPGD